MSRRRFLAASAGWTWTAFAFCGPAAWAAAASREASRKKDADGLWQLVERAYPARYWVSTATAGDDCTRCHGSDPPDDPVYDHGQVFIRCELCAQQCMIAEGERGRCRTRINVDGRLLSLVYGRPVSVHIDPIEKKPLYHFMPGSQALSLATTGCPLSCRFCQNWQISQARPEDYRISYAPPEAVAGAATSRQVPVIAYTYNEPTVFAEYLMDIARIGAEQGLANVMISCGYASPRAMTDLCRILDAVKIDLKGFSREFYRTVCGAELAPVLSNIREVARQGVHLEIVNLVVPTLNDSASMLEELSRWVVGEVGPDVPVHFTRFHPDYQLRNLAPTPVATLERAYEIAKKHGMNYPYVGNVPGHPGNNTYCPQCGKAVIRRAGFFVTETDIQDGACAFCGRTIAGVFKLPRGNG
jgi:pyruvate formate lyase activating enzyme